ncbi:carboxymuconolactone decarboxylase family protein [Agromyces kandeliae]|uniref:Carboxymuconolactone decarboxylase family protein n=1 Tax=Agromyces kandeliae TaxID=2666141 RepID=A0A6L5R3X2_9MICO|nr:carboxymuconolactone decarboxylase family protein [Agromyces kandeliae]MRX44771.1 carboxymuconolactone decarboxylase family protein [Agromyces kandeliae]
MTDTTTDTTTRVPVAELTGPLGALARFGARRMIGRVPDSVGVMWHNRRVLLDLMGIGRKAEKWSALDANLGSYASMAAAAAIGCGFCLDFHYFLSHDHGLDEEKAREVPRWRASSVFTPLERRVMEYAEAMCETPVAVTDELSDALLAELGPAALVELSAKVGLMNATARGNIALGIRSEHFADACGLPPLATGSAVVEAA